MPTRRTDRGYRPRPQGRGRDQGRPHRRTRMPGHARPHDVAYLRARARRRTRRCSAATRCSTPAPATAITAVIRTSCTTPSRRSCRSCPTTRWSIRATIISATICALRWTASRTTPRPRNCCPSWKSRTPTRPLVTTLGLEKEVNTFFRLTSPSVIRRLREAFPDLPDNPDQRTVFLKLRELRNKW